MDYNTVSFPGFGIGEFTINPTAFKITENITIEWYAIIICVGILAAYLFAIAFEQISNQK